MLIEELSVEFRESLSALVERLRREYLVMTRAFERVCRDRQEQRKRQALTTRGSSTRTWKKGSEQEFVTCAISLTCRRQES